MDKQTTYYQLFPVALHRQVDEVIDHLTYFPFERPECCVHCGSKSFAAQPHPLQKIPGYRCSHCNRGFNRLTGTLFAHCRHVQLWGEFAKAKFSGWPRQKIMDTFNLSTQAINFRDKVLIKFLKVEYPEVYKWWKPYQYGRRKVILNDDIKNEIKVLKLWIKQAMSPKQVLCPVCQHMMRRRSKHRPYFCCYRCDTQVNTLTGTPLFKMAFAEQWDDFIKLLIQGKGDLEISKRLAISMSTSNKWRTNILTIIQQQELTKLYDWIIWQRKRSEAKAIIAAFKNKKKSPELNGAV